MSNWGAGLNGLASGVSNGLVLGRQIRGAMDDYSLQKVREQGIAEAQAAAAAAAPKLTDNGDMQNLTSNPQMSTDPNAAPESINTSLASVLANAQQDPAQQDPAQVAQGMGIKTSAVPAPDAPEATDAAGLSSTPQASRPDGSTLEQAVAGKDLPNLDAAANAGGPLLSAPKRFNVDGQEFDDEKSARDYISKHTPKAEEFYNDTLVPKMKARLLELGRDKEAAAWQDYADNDQTRKNFQTWDKARRLADFGDQNGAAQELFKLHPHYADGYDLVNTTPTKGPDGSDGFTMTVKAPDGTTQQIYQNSETITRMGLPLLHPVEAFTKEYDALNKVDQARAKEAVDVRDDNRRANRESANIAQRDADAVARAKLVQTELEKRQQVRGQQQSDLETQRQSGRGALLDKKLAASVATAAAKASQGGGGYRKGKSPDEWMASAVLELQKDPMFSMKTPDQKQAAKDQLWSMMPDSIRNGVGKPASQVPYAAGLPNASTAGAPSLAPPGPGQSVASPFSMPAPGASSAPTMAPAGMKPRYNPATGLVEMVPR
jgi:hypothetical protein